MKGEYLPQDAIIAIFLAASHTPEWSFNHRLQFFWLCWPKGKWRINSIRVQLFTATPSPVSAWLCQHGP
jgi:hypothetical protein